MGISTGRDWIEQDSGGIERDNKPSVASSTSGESEGQEDRTAASPDLGEITKNTDWYTFKEYGKTLTAIAPPKDRALKVVFMAAEPREIEGTGTV